jgi:N-acetyl-gamma-glutamyl-phosphate reductase
VKDKKNGKNMKKISVGILGASSYTGMELVRLCTYHPGVTIDFLSSRSYAGKPFDSIFPEMKGIVDTELTAPEQTDGHKPDCVFSCLPHAVSAKYCLPFIEKGIRVIDLSADFRLTDEKEYALWYAADHPCPSYLSQAVYGLPEFYRKAIQSSGIVANPGCYPTGVLLPLLPLLSEGSILVSGVIVDAKSGMSGAGRTLKLTSHFVEAHENFSPYSIGRAHRHIAEIDQELTNAAGTPFHITFSPHLLPLSRGIVTTIYFSANVSAQECFDVVSRRYAEEPFIRIRRPDDLPSIKPVTHTNYCDITFTGGTDGQPLIAVSAIDNLLKGASGQALQNMNIMFGIPETTGLLR